MELIQEKDVEKITVTDIITRADINRGTFYAHYQDIPEEIKKTPEFIIHLHFMAGGIINLYQVWLRGGLNSSIQDITYEIWRILSIYPECS